MPRTVTIKKRKIILNESCSKILQLFSTVLSDNGLSVEKDSSALSSVNASSKTAIDGNLIDSAKRVFENTFGVALGGHGQDLPECRAEMDTGGFALFTTYQEYWVSLMRQDEQLDASKLIAETIEEPYILIMEFHLRLAMQAMRLDSPLRSDQERRLFLNILSNFSVQLSKQLMLGSTLQQKLFADHKAWLGTLVNTANQIDKMNKAKPILAENLAYLESLQKKIIRYLILSLAKDGKLSLSGKWAGKLEDTQLNLTLQESETKILSHVKTTSLQEEQLENDLSIVAYASQNSRKSQGIACSEMDLVTCGILSKKNVRNQKIIVAISRASSIKDLYALLNKTKIIYQFLGKIDDLVQSMGWLPLLFHVVELDDIDKAISTQVALCQTLFESLQPRGDFLTTSFGKEFSECTHNDLVTRNPLPKLSALQNPELLEGVFLQMRLDLERLEKLGALSGCAVVCNPFPQKTMKNSARIETNNAAGIASKILDGQLHASQRKLASRANSSSQSTHFFSAPEEPEKTKFSDSKISSNNPFVTMSVDANAKKPFVPKSVGSSPGNERHFDVRGGRGRSISTGKNSSSTSRGNSSSSTNPFGQFELTQSLPSFSVFPSIIQNHNEYEKKQEKGRIFAAYDGEAEKRQQPVEDSVNEVFSNVESKAKIQVKTGLEDAKKIKFKTDILYIQTFIDSMGGLGDDELRKSLEIFFKPNYFNNKRVSEFCRKTSEIILSFLPKMRLKKPCFGVQTVLHLRHDEIALLQYLCVEAAQLGDDSRLMNFINTMIEMTEEAVFWVDYNKLKNDLKALLTSQRQGKIIAFCMLKNDAVLVEERQSILKENSEVHEKCQELRAKVATLEKENREVKNENQGLKQQNFSVTRHLALELGNLKEQVQRRDKLVQSEIEAIKQNVQNGKKQGSEIEQEVAGLEGCRLF